MRPKGHKGSNPLLTAKLMRGSFNGKITGFHPVVKGSIPLPRTKLCISSVMAASRIPNPLGQGSSPWGYASF